MRLLLAGDLDGGERLARQATEVGWRGHHLDVARAATTLARRLGLRSVDGRAAELLLRLTPG
jgi:hypothetical protein